MAFKDEARFYTIDGKEYPSVTTILSVIDKSGPLMHWAVNEERKAIEWALMEVLTGEHSNKPEEIWKAILEQTKGVKAMKKTNKKALDIGSNAHEWIEWKMKTILGGQEPEPVLLTDEAKIAVMSFEDWAKDVHLEPVAVEMQVFSKIYGYAGRIDLLAWIDGVFSLIDWKTGKAIYPESFLQSVAYRQAIYETNLENHPIQGIVVRLPKTLEDPRFEVKIVPDEYPNQISSFIGAKAIWEWKRLNEGKKIGN